MHSVYKPAIAVLGLCLREMKKYVHAETWAQMFPADLFLRAPHSLDVPPRAKQRVAEPCMGHHSAIKRNDVACARWKTAQLEKVHIA